MSNDIIHSTPSPYSDDYDKSVIIDQVYDHLQRQLKLQQQELLQHKESFIKDNSYLQTTPNQINTSLNLNWSFTQGLIIGQLSVIFVIGIFIKFFVFADSTTISPKTSSKDASNVIVKRDKVNSEKSDKDKDLMDNYLSDNEDEHVKVTKSKLASILEKTYYDVDNHSSESLDWFNVLIAQTISQLRTEALLSDNIYHSLNEFLSKLELPDYLDKIKITEIDIGDDFPIFSNCRIRHSKDGSGRLEAKIDVDLSDTLTLGIDTKLLLNHPRPLTAVLPVQLSVSIVRFSGCLTVSLINTNDPEFTDISQGNNLSNNNKDHDSSSNSNGTALMFSFSPDYRLEFTVKSLIGSRAKLQDVPKISSLIENKLRSWFIERCIEPRFQVVKLPSLWPRRKNTREPVHSNVNGIVDKTEEAL